MMGKDLMGWTIGRITARWPSGIGKNGHIYWLCSCSCGNLKVIRGSHLTDHTKSCGCWKFDALKKHGHARKRRTLTYKTWEGIIQRCTNPRASRYSYYGGRGITVCAEWLDFKNFLRDMGVKPPGLSIERIRNNEGYSKGNCKWATATEQSRNRRKRKV